MIRLTRAGEYAIRAVLHLAAQPSGQIVDRDQVARAQDIPPSFLSKILQRLSTAGIIRSYKGASGGFCLARSAEEITMLEVIKAIEGPLALNQCLLDADDCDRLPVCPVHPVWCRVQAGIEEILGQVSFAELVEGNGDPNLIA